jgi:hypothetical protein
VQESVNLQRIKDALYAWIDRSAILITRNSRALHGFARNAEVFGVKIIRTDDKENGIRVKVEVDRKIAPDFPMSEVWKSMEEAVSKANEYATKGTRLPDGPYKNDNYAMVRVGGSYESDTNPTVCFWIVLQKERSVVICAQMQDKNDKASAELTILDINHDDNHAMRSIPLYKHLHGLIKNNEKFVKLRDYMNDRRDSSEMESFQGRSRLPTVRPRAVFGCAACGKLIVNG